MLPAVLNQLPGFDHFRLRNGNFAYGFQAIGDSDVFLSTLEALSGKNSFDDAPVSCEKYLSELAAILPAPLYDYGGAESH